MSVQLVVMLVAASVKRAAVTLSRPIMKAISLISTWAVHNKVVVQLRQVASYDPDKIYQYCQRSNVSTWYSLTAVKMRTWVGQTVIIVETLLQLSS